jgi:hypothetical protein
MLCINAAIHSKDAICLSEFGSSHRNLPHAMAGKQLRGILGVGPGLSSGYSRTRGKSEVEYSSVFISQEAAATALKRTEAFFQVVVGHLNR